jgi:hypothetical protein
MADTGARFCFENAIAISALDWRLGSIVCGVAFLIDLKSMAGADGGE